MKPDLATFLLAGFIALSQVGNIIMFLRIRVGQLETEQRVAEKFDEKLKEYVRKDSAIAAGHTQGAQC